MIQPADATCTHSPTKTQSSSHGSAQPIRDQMIWNGNHYKGSKIQITLLIKYLKARILFEIRITSQARSIISSLNDSCLFSISMQEHLFEIRITPQARLIKSSLSDSAYNLKLHRIGKKLSHWLKKKTQMLLLIYFPNLPTNTTFMSLYSLKMKLLKVVQSCNIHT